MKFEEEIKKNLPKKLMEKINIKILKPYHLLGKKNY